MSQVIVDPGWSKEEADYLPKAAESVTHAFPLSTTGTDFRGVFRVCSRCVSCHDCQKATTQWAEVGGQTEICLAPVMLIVETAEIDIGGETLDSKTLASQGACRCSDSMYGDRVSVGLVPARCNDSLLGQ